MNLEQLVPDTICPTLEERLQKLAQVHKEVEKETRRLPEGQLRIAQKAKHVEYYASGRNNNRGTYITKRKLKVAVQLAQKAYNQHIIKIIEKEMRAIENYLRQTHNGNAITNYFKSLCQPRRNLITPVTLTEDRYIKEWQNVQWMGLPFDQDSPEMFTTNGERVRSKSEVLIADTLKRFGIPYRYEYPLRLKNEITVHPDFLCLNVRTRQEFYWEHFGMMTTPDYAQKAIHKLQQYSDNHLLPGINLIITMETATSTLNLKYIEQQIKTYLT